MRPDPIPSSMHFESIEELHRFIRPVMQAIASATGPHCEVVLHDLSSADLSHSIYDIINGNVTGRSVGGPSTNLGAKVLQDPEADHDAYGYRGLTSDGRNLLSSSIYFRNHAGRVIAALCINTDLTPLEAARAAIDELLPGAEDTARTPTEIISPDVTTVLEDMITEAIEAEGMPAALMSKTERTNVLRRLEDRGAFTIKRAAERVATRLGVSRVTVYSYLDEIRRGQ